MKIVHTNIKDLLIQQLKSFFLLDSSESDKLEEIIQTALPRAEQCFRLCKNKYYHDEDGGCVFNPYHSGQYSIFLYYASHSSFELGFYLLADKLYYLNKTLNCCDLYHGAQLPEIFFLDHPLGSVMGRASYSNFFVFQQNCTVGGNHGVYPKFGEFVWLFANSTVIGDSTIGDNVFISANTLVKDESIPNNSIVFGSSPHLIVKEKPREYFHRASPFVCHHDS